jgi:hypothetical protein
MSAAPETRPQTGSCGINFQLNGASFSATNTCSEYIATANITTTAAGENTHRNYDITLHDGEKILAPLAGGLKGLKVESGTFVVAKVGTLTDAKNVTLKLFVERKKLFGDDTLINRTLKSSEYSYQAIDDKTGYVRINMDKVFGGIDSSKKHVIRLNLSVSLPQGTVLSGGAVANRDLAQSSQITID